MKIGYLDCFAGASGDMIVGAIIDAGCDSAIIQSQLDLLSFPEVKLAVESVRRHGLKGTLVHFQTAETSPPHRSLSDINRILTDSKLEPDVVQVAMNIFRRIGEAEAKMHGVTIDRVHFHEVGALDTICDIVSAVVGFRHLGIEKLYASAILLGSGVIDSAHGRIPIPSPATQEIVREFPVRRIDSGVEMTTPTGAAIISELAEFAPGYEMRVESVGYGAGTRDDESAPNLLRLVVGTPLTEALADEVVVIETNIDDATPEEIGHLQERLIASGAMDVYVTSIMMKKNRPGFLVSVISDSGQSENLATLVLRESSTAGLRLRRERRRKLDRKIETLTTEFGEVRIKFLFDGDIRKFSPEYDDVVKVADAAGVPFARVYRSALEAAAKMQGDSK